MTKSERKSTIKVFNRTTGKTSEIVRRPRKVDTKAQRELGAEIKRIDSLGFLNMTPEHRSELIAEAERMTALRKLDAPKSMLNHRIRQLKSQGFSNVRIGATLGIHESTVRRRLMVPLEPIEILLDKILFDLEETRSELLTNLLDHKEFGQVFNVEYGDDFFKKHTISTHTNARKVQIDPKLNRIKISLEFIAKIQEQA